MSNRAEDVPVSDEVLQEIARQGGRKAVLFELSAPSTPYRGIRFMAHELGMEDAPLSEQAEKFAEEVGQHHSDSPFVEWDRLETEYGEKADAVLASIDAEDA